MKLVTSTQMRALEQRADAAGNTYALMMERAGKSVADAIQARWDVRGKHALVLVGPGNNGGDGLVCARHLHDAGARVHLYLWKRARTDDDANLRECLERRIPLIRAEEDLEFHELEARINECEMLIDALLGTGVTRPIEGALKELLAAVKKSPRLRVPASQLTNITPAPLLPRSPAFVVAVDLPSGLNPDTGALDPAALPAHLTVTFAFPKIGQMLFPGANAVGELVVADIGIRAEWADGIALEVATATEIAARLPARPRAGHKGTFGKALICAGSLNYTGAAYLAGVAATRAGAGLVTLALPCAIYPIVAASAHETTFLPLPDDDGVLIPRAARVVRERMAEYDALLIGPGFGRAAGTVRFVQNVIARKTRLATLAPPARAGVTQTPMVIDADALFALAQTREWWTRLAPQCAILTPHPGEMATLCGISRDEIQRDRIGIARRFAQMWQQVIVLKGAHSVVAAPDGRVTLIPFATPALATAGSGDVLAGTIIALLAQMEGAGKPRPYLYDAAIVGAYLHGLAGKIAEDEIGAAGVVAGDLLARLPRAWRVAGNE